MYLADYHTHTRCSPDSSAPLDAMARAAVEAGLTSLCVTDHCDLVNRYAQRVHSLDWAPLLEQYHAVRAAYGDALDLRLGLELGSAQVEPPVSRAILDQPELDFVIGSLHNRTLASGGADFYDGEYTSPEVCYEALDDYFTSMAVLATIDEFYDVLGHIIYPLRYMARDGQTDISLARYTDRLRAILRAAVERGRGIEVNTWCGRTVEPWREILSLYKDLGGEIITVGSDAHSPDNVGKGVRETHALLADMGFRYVAAYRGRKPEFQKIEL